MKLPELSTVEYGLVGHPLGHSRSKELFTGWHKTYENFDLAELTPSTLYTLVLLNPKLKGFNVTAPYKETVMQFLDSLDATAEKVGAVNTVRIKRADDGRVLALDGFNTDYIGFYNSAKPMIDALGSSAKALILGTGGAAKAVAAVLADMGVEFKFVSRSRNDDRTISYDRLTDAIVAGHLFIVNTTPLGTYPDVETCPPIPYHAVGVKHKCFDLVYNPAETEFMKRCKDRGAEVKNGMEMLEGQALASLNIWNNK